MKASVFAKTLAEKKAWEAVELIEDRIGGRFTGPEQAYMARIIQEKIDQALEDLKDAVRVMAEKAGVL